MKKNGLYKAEFEAAVINEEIAGLKNLKIHFQMKGDFEKVQKLSKAINLLTELIGA